MNVRGFGWGWIRLEEHQRDQPVFTPPDVTFCVWVEKLCLEEPLPKGSPRSWPVVHEVSGAVAMLGDRTGTLCVEPGQGGVEHPSGSTEATMLKDEGEEEHEG